jgi:predicted DNA-binding antitoxin AbrB/MazE fold protein
MGSVMSEPILAVYEHGVLRPLAPLPLSEHARVHIQIVSPPTNEENQQQRVRQALIDAQVIQPRPKLAPGPEIKESALQAAAAALATAGPLSALILEEREGR